MKQTLPFLVAYATDQTASHSTDWELVLKALGFVVTAFVAYNQIKNLQSGSRAALKTDLDILNLIKADDPNYAAVKQRITERIRILYAPRAPRNWLMAWNVVFGLILGFGFAYWTFRLVQPGFTWWSLLTGYVALTGIGAAVMALRGRSPFRRFKYEI
jgi:hypothetical protein